MVAIAAGFGLGLGEFSSLAISNAKKFNEFAAVLKKQPPERTTEILISDLHTSHIFSIALAKLIEKALVFCIVLAVLNAVTLTIIWLQSRKLVDEDRIQD